MKIHQVITTSLNPNDNEEWLIAYFESLNLARERRRKEVPSPVTPAHQRQYYTEVRSYEGMSEEQARKLGYLDAESEVDLYLIETEDTKKKYYISFDMYDVFDPVKTLEENTGKCQAAIYRLAKKLGRLPTPQEILAQNPGRPRKY